MWDLRKFLGEFISSAEPLVVTLFFLFIVALGFFLRDVGTKAKRKIFKRKAAPTKDLLR